MADRRTGFQQRGNQANRGRRSPEREGFWFGDFDDTPVRSSVPESNGPLFNAYRKEDFPETGLTIDRLQLSEKRVGLHVDTRGETVRLNERSLGEDLPTLQDIANSDLSLEKRGETRIISGEMAPVLATALIIRDPSGKERIAAFNRPELEVLGRGVSGPTGLMQDLPGHQSVDEVNNEFLLIGKTKFEKEKVVVVVDDGESREHHATRVARIRHRIAEQKLREGLASAGKDLGKVREANKQAAENMKHLKIVVLKKKKPSADLNEHLINIRTEIDGHTEETRGMVQHNIAQRRPVVITPVTVEPEDSKIAFESLQIMDATGKMRDIEIVDAPARGQLDYIQHFARHLGHGATVQKEARGPVIVPPPLEVRLAHNPVTALPLQKAA